MGQRINLWLIGWVLLMGACGGRNPSDCRCDPGKICHEHRCVAPCNSTHDCAHGESCQSGLCLDADPKDAVKLAVACPAALYRNQCVKCELTLLNAYDDPVATSAMTSVDLSATMNDADVTGVFYSDPSCASMNPMAQIGSSQTTVEFFFRTASTGGYAITATSGSLASGLASGDVLGLAPTAVSLQAQEPLIHTMMTGKGMAPGAGHPAGEPTSISQTLAPAYFERDEIDWGVGTLDTSIALGGGDDPAALVQSNVEVVDHYDDHSVSYTLQVEASFPAAAQPACEFEAPHDGLMCAMADVEVTRGDLQAATIAVRAYALNGDMDADSLVSEPLAIRTFHFAQVLALHGNDEAVTFTNVGKAIAFDDRLLVEFSSSTRGGKLYDYDDAIPSFRQMTNFSEDDATSDHFGWPEVYKGELLVQVGSLFKLTRLSLQRCGPPAGHHGGEPK